MQPPRTPSETARAFGLRATSARHRQRDSSLGWNAPRHTEEAVFNGRHSLRHKRMPVTLLRSFGISIEGAESAPSLSASSRSAQAITPRSCHITSPLWGHEPKGSREHILSAAPSEADLIGLSGSEAPSPFIHTNPDAFRGWPLDNIPIGC
jgi:hypothetical protein